MVTPFDLVVKGRPEFQGGLLFLLRDDFPGDAAAPLASPRTCVPGPGTLTIYDTTYKLAIVNGELVLSGYVTDGGPQAYSASFTRQAGLALLAKFHGVTSTSRFRIKLCDNALIALTMLKPQNIDFAIPIPTTLARWSLVLKKLGAFFVDETVLRWIDITQSGNAGAYFTPYTSYVSDAHLDTLRVARLPGLPSDAVKGNGYAEWGHRDVDRTDFLAAPAAGNTFTHTADGVLRVTVTTIPDVGQTIRIFFRIQDSQNYWRLRLQNTAGVVTSYLDEFIGGGQNTRGSGGTFSSGDILDLVFLGSKISLYQNSGGSPIWTYASATNYVTCTSGKVDTIGTGGVIANLSTRTLDGIGQAAALQVTDFGANGLHGTPTAVGLVGQPSEGGQYNGSTAYTNIFSTAFNTKFNGQAGSIIARTKCPASIWTDGTAHALFQIRNATNSLLMQKMTANNSVLWEYVAGGVTKQRTKIGISSVDWIDWGFTWSLLADSAQAYYDGAPEGAALTGLGTWAGALLTAELGRLYNGVYYWSGAEGDVIISFGVVATPTQMSTIHTKLAAGTLTADDLNTIFGSGNYTWYRHTDRKTVALPGIATDVLAGPRAQQDWFSHEAEGLLEFQIDALPTTPDVSYVSFRCVQIQQQNLYLRINDDGSGHVRQISPGDTALATWAAGGVAVGSRVVVICEGTTIKVYGNTTLLCTATATIPSTGTVAKVTQLTGTAKMSSFITWPRNLAAAPLTLGAARALQALNAMSAGG